MLLKIYEVVAGLYLFVDCTCLCDLCRRLDTTHKGLLPPGPCLYASVKVDRKKEKKYHQRHRQSKSGAEVEVKSKSSALRESLKR